MKGFHGIIFAYNASSALGSLVTERTAASLPFCGRYRLIDFALSSLRNAGVFDVGVIMQRDYQSLLDHIGSGKDWDMDRRIGGLRMLPPFGLPEYHTGNYTGTIEALNAVSTYISDVKEKYIVMMHGNLAANLDLGDVIESHIKSGADITRVRKMFRDSLLDYRAKAEAIHSAEIYRNAFAISECASQGHDSPTVIGAQAANELLDISGIKASIVLTEFDNKIYLSARSIDEVNVQVMMEQLGGGGHRSIAGAQLEKVSMEEARYQVRKVIDEMILRGEVK